METMNQLLKAAEAKGITHEITSEDEGLVSAIYVKVKEGCDIGKVNSAIQGHTRKASAVRTKSMITDVSDSLSGVSRTVTWLIAVVWILSFVILLIVFSVITFVLPFKKNTLFWLSYAFGVFAILFQLYVLMKAFHGTESVRSRFYGFPIAKVGLIYMVI